MSQYDGNRWNEIGNMFQGRYGHRTIAIGTEIYIIGGHGDL